MKVNFSSPVAKFVIGFFVVVFILSAFSSRNNQAKQPTQQPAVTSQPQQQVATQQPVAPTPQAPASTPNQQPDPRDEAIAQLQRQVEKLQAQLRNQETTSQFQPDGNNKQLEASILDSDPKIHEDRIEYLKDKVESIKQTILNYRSAIDRTPTKNPAEINFRRNLMNYWEKELAIAGKDLSKEETRGEKQ